MKKLIILSAIAISGLAYNTADAQIGVNLGFRIGNARAVVAQAPVYNDNDDDFYYLPDLGVYYDVDAQCYYYFNGETWVATAYLPGAYRDFDWSTARRFEVRERRPYLRDDFYRERFEGRRVGDWGRRDNDGYAYRRDNDNRFDNSSYGYRRDNDNRYANGGNAFRRDNDQRFENGGYKRNDEHFDNRGQGADNRQFQQNKDNGQRFDNRGQDHGGQQFQNRGQGGYGQYSNQNRNQNRDNRGGNDHYNQNNPKGGYGDHKMTKF